MQLVQTLSTRQALVSTDPPYYDNIGYADLSDFFYALAAAHILKSVFPELFATVARAEGRGTGSNPLPTPVEAREPRRCSSLDGMTRGDAAAWRNRTHPTFPVTIYYAFKQSEAK